MRYSFYLLLLSVWIIGCQKTITVEQKPYAEKISIEGLLQPGEVPQIYVNRTAPFFTDIASQTASNMFIRDAQIQLLSAGAMQTLRPDSSYNQFFCRWEPFYIGSAEILANATYELRVTHEGQVHTATTVTNVPSVNLDSVSYTSNFTDIFGGHEGVIMDFTDLPNQPNQYRSLITRPLHNRHQTTDDLEYSSTCLADGEFVEISEFGRSVYFDNKLDGAPVRFVAEPVYTQFMGDEATIYIQSLDEEVARFYDTLDRQHTANVNPFSEPVFLYSTFDRAIGVFGAVNISSPFPFVFPEDHLN